MIQETSLPLGDGGLDRGDGGGAKSDMVEGVDNDIGVHGLHLPARYGTECVGELAAVERDIGGSNVLAVE